MKYYVKKEGLKFSAVFFLGDRIAAQTGIAGQDLGQAINHFTNGEGEQIEELPDGILLRDGVICWRVTGEQRKIAENAGTNQLEDNQRVYRVGSSDPL